jgi:hypothetical protein
MLTPVVALLSLSLALSLSPYCLHLSLTSSRHTPPHIPLHPAPCIPSPLHPAPYTPTPLYPRTPVSCTPGITLTEADVTGRSLPDREQDCTRALAHLARRSHYALAYVGDNSGRYGLQGSPRRREAATQTIWLVLER